MRRLPLSGLTTRLTSAALAGTLTLLAACGGDDDPPTVNTGSITVALSASTLSLTQGESETATVTITRAGGFSEAVTLAAEGAPDGVTVSFAPASVPGNATTSTLTLAASGEAAAGTYPITVRASGQGVTTKTAQLSLTVAAAQSPAYTIALSPASLTVAQGARDSAAIQIVRAGGFTGPVTLALSGVPDGVARGITVNPVTADTSTVKFEIGAAVPAGVYPVTLTGTAEGLTNRTVQLSLTVTSTAPAQSFALALAPTAVTVQAGGAAATSTATVTRAGGFNGAVALAATGAPAGLTVSVNPTSVTGTTATISVQAAAGLAAGTHQITVTGTGTGVTQQTATLAVTVTAGGGAGTTITLAYCAEDTPPLWVGMQDGDGAWTRVTAGTGGSYSITFSANRGGIASVEDLGGGQYSLDVFYASATEMQQIANSAAAQSCDPGTPTGKTINGSVANVSATEIASIALGSATTSVIPTLGTNFQLTAVPDGARDLIAARLTGATFAANKFIVRRGINPANGSTLPVLDFNAAESFAPVTSQVTVTGIGGDDASLFASLTTANGTTTNLNFASDVSDGAFAYLGFPADRLQAGDLQQAVVVASSPNDGPNSRFASFYFTSSANRTLALGPTLAPTVSSLATTPSRRLRAVLPVATQYELFASASYAQEDGNEASVSMTSGYRGNATSWTLDMPDLSGVTGYNAAAWGLSAAAPTAYTVSAYGGFFSFVLGGAPQDGSTFQFASREGSFNGSVSQSLLGRTTFRLPSRYVAAPPRLRQR